MKTIAIFLTFLVLAGCGGQDKDEQKTEKPGVMETPTPSPEPTETPATPTPEPTPTAEPSTKPVSKPAVEKNATIMGEVVDIVSYSTSGVLGSTASGKEIIMGSAKGGNPLGILEKSSGEVYIVTMKQANTPANPTLLPFVGMQIAAKGDIYRKGGQRLLVMNTVGKSMQ